MTQKSETAVNAKISAFVPEGALAAKRVLDRLYPGKWAQIPLVKQSLFGTYVVDPTDLRVQVSAGVYESAPYNGVKIQGIGTVEFMVSGQNGMPIFYMHATVQGEAAKERFEQFALAVEKQVKDSPLYRGKAIKMAWPNEQEGEEWSFDSAPDFIDLRRFDPENVVLSPSVRSQVNKSVLTPIRKTDYCRELGLSVKRGVLLAGAPGNGKTLVASLIGHECEQNGWTFVYLKSGAKDLGKAYNYVSRWAPVVLFAEDVDRVARGRQREAIYDNLLNTLDGVDTKHNDVILVLSTNDLDSIRPEMLRPGRLDSIIRVDAPGHEEIAKLIRNYSYGELQDGFDPSAVCAILLGQNAASVREAVDRARLGALWDGAKPGEIVLTEGSLEDAAREVVSQTRRSA